MRSARPKPLHLLCGRAMVLLRPRLARRACPSTGVVVVVGHGAERVTKKLQEEARRPAPRLRRAARAAGHRRRGQRRPHRLPRRRPRRRDDVLVLPGDTPLLRADDARRARRARTARPAPPPPCSPPRSTTPRGYGRVVRGKDDRVARSSRRPTPPTRSGRSTRSTRRSTASAAACWRRRCAALSPENAQGEYYLTDVVEVLPRRRLPGGARAGRRRRRDPGRQRPPPAGRRRGRAAAAHQRRAGCAAGVTMVDPEPHLHRRHRRAVGPTSPCSRAPCSRAARVDRRAAPRSAPTPAWSTAWSAPGAVVEHTVAARRRDRRRRRTSGPSPCSIPATTVASGARHRARSTLRPGSSAGADGSGPTREQGRDGAGDEEAPAPRTPAGPTRRSPRRSPTTSASSSGERQPGRVRQRRDPLPLRRVGPGHRRLHHPDPRRRRGPSVNDSIMEQLIMIDAAKRASAKRITAVCPLYGYARQDRKAEGREPITAKLVANMFTAAGANRLVSASTCTPARSRASSTGPSTTSRPCRCSSTTCARTRATTSSSSPPTPAG